MDAYEAQTAHKSIRAQLDAGQIPIDDYYKKVSELRYQDKTGTWWAVSPADGSWLCWNGIVWEPAFGHRESVSAVTSEVQPTAHKVQPSWYIPPSGNTPEPVVQARPSFRDVHPGEPSVLQISVPWHHLPKGKIFAMISIACGALAFVIFPYIFGCAGIILGIISIKEKYTSGAIGIVVSAAGILITYFLSVHPELFL
jgi:hypothetical protein